MKKDNFPLKKFSLQNSFYETYFFRRLQILIKFRIVSSLILISYQLNQIYIFELVLDPRNTKKKFPCGKRGKNYTYRYICQTFVYALKRISTYTYFDRIEMKSYPAIFAIFDWGKCKKSFI